MENDALRLWVAYDPEAELIGLVCAESRETAAEAYQDEFDINTTAESWVEATEDDLREMHTERLGGGNRIFTADQYLAIAAYEPGFLDYTTASAALLKSLDERQRAEAAEK